jgi:hypothetical protein
MSEEKSAVDPKLIHDTLKLVVDDPIMQNLQGKDKETETSKTPSPKTKAELIAEAEAELAAAGDDEEKKKAAGEKLDAAKAMPDDVENTTTGVSENIPPATMYNISNEAGVDPPGTNEADKKFIYKSKEDVDKARADLGMDTLLPAGGRRRTRRHHKKGDKKSRRQSKKGGKKHRKSAKKGSSKSKRSRRYSSRK